MIITKFESSAGRNFWVTWFARFSRVATSQSHGSHGSRCRTTLPFLQTPTSLPPPFLILSFSHKTKFSPNAHSGIILLLPPETKLGRRKFPDKKLPFNDQSSLSSASNYIITGSTGFETAKACAIVEDSRMEENLLLDENLIATKSGESIDIAMIGTNSS